MDSKQDSIDLVTAADRLGLSVATLRKRLQHGTLSGFKAADGTWRVVLDKVDNTLDKAGQDYAALVEALRSENQFLRSQLQARDDDIRRLHVLLQQHQRQPASTLPDHSGDWMQQWMRLWLWWLPR